ncbi:hypothetical protein AB685_17055 [Bacillus sp. LL01]|uniref:hypothetical protein n=1 Tax=Bacillus sp. LL01 TaxID=1665556 RepID=UPI00064D7058|nr:hypothetical protein [Bacillus sp. LL01]KMJ57124.1 hypothetical protein AB685_17055 [Bacillus sp. LL01]
MKIHPKVRSVQQKYRKTIEHKKEKKKHTVEAVVVIFFFIILLVLLNEFQTTTDKYIPIDASWMEVIPQIEETLKRTTVEYKGIAVDFNPKPTKYILKTSFEESTLNVEDSLTELINITNELIRLSNIPKDEPYVIIVEGDNKEELARKVFNNSKGL